MDYSTKVLPAAKVLTLLLVVGAVSCSPLPTDPSSSPTGPPATHLELPVHSVEVSHEIRHVSVEVNAHSLDLSITSDQDEVNEHALDQDAADSTPEQEPPLPSDNPTSPYNIRHLGFTPTGYIDTLHPVYTHPTPPKIIEAKDNVQNKKEDEEVVDAASTPEPSGTISSHDAETDNDFPQPEGEPESEYIGLELDDEPVKDIADQISVILQPIQDDISKNFDGAVKSISDATNEAKNILEPIQDDISKNIEETIESINEATDEHINNAADSIKNAVNYIKTAAEPITSDDQNIVSETDIDENINDDFEIIEEKSEPIESDYERIDDAFEFIRDEPIITAERRVGSEDTMNNAMKVNIENILKANIENKDENISEHTLEADSLGNDIPQDDSHIEAMPNEDTTETPVLVENPPQEDQPPSKDIVKEESITEELPQVDLPLEAKDQEENDVFIDAVKRSDTGTENTESPKEDEPLEDATLNESDRESRVYIEKVDGIPEEKPIDSEEAPKDIIPEDPVQDVPEINNEESAQESAATSPIPNVNHEEVVTEHKEIHGDAKMATNSPIEVVEKESEISHDIPIDTTQNEESNPIIENESTSNNNGNEEEILEETVEDVQSSGDEHVDEEVPEINEDETLNEAEEPLDEATEAPVVIPSASEDKADEHVDPVAGAPLPDQVITHHEPTEKKTSPPKGKTSPPKGKTSPPRGVPHQKADIPRPKPKADQNDQVHHHKLSASDKDASAPRFLPPSQEQVSIAEPTPLGAGAIVGIIFGVLVLSSAVVGVVGFLIYQRRFHIRPKTLNSDRGYAGSDSGGYIDDDAVRVSYVNSQTDMPKDQTFRLRLNTQD